MSDAKVEAQDPGIRRAASAQTPRIAPRALAAALGALRRWWAAERHYRPERRYMHGGGEQPAAARALARR